MSKSDILCSNRAPHINHARLTVIRYFRKKVEINVEYL